MLWLKQPNGDWQSVDGLPKGAMQLTTTSRGIVAFGHCLGPGQDTEIWDPDSDASGITWLSEDGLSWLAVEQDEPYRHIIEAVFETGDELIGLGFDARRFNRDKPAGAVWVSPLPPSDPAQWVSAPPSYAEETCGDYY